MNARFQVPPMQAAVFFLSLAALCVPALAQRSPTVLSVQDARRLVIAAVRTRKTPGLSLEEYTDKSSPQFYFFTAVWDNPYPNGSVVLGNYAVDQVTADVWDAAMACREISNTAVRKLQREMRSRIGLSHIEYRKKRRSCPLEMAK